MNEQPTTPLPRNAAAEEPARPVPPAAARPEAASPEPETPGADAATHGPAADAAGTDTAGIGTAGTGDARTGGTDADAPVRRGARVGPIVWGVLVLVLCAFVLQRTVAPGLLDPLVWVTVVVLGLGALLLVVAFAVIARDRRRGSR